VNLVICTPWFVHVISSQAVPALLTVHLVNHHWQLAWLNTVTKDPWLVHVLTDPHEVESLTVH